MFHKLQLVITSSEMNKLCHSHILLKGAERTRSKIMGQIFDACLNVFLSDLLNLPYIELFKKCQVQLQIYVLRLLTILTRKFITIKKNSFLNNVTSTI